MLECTCSLYNANSSHPHHILPTSLSPLQFHDFFSSVLDSPLIPGSLLALLYLLCFALLCLAVPCPDGPLPLTQRWTPCLLFYTHSLIVQPKADGQKTHCNTSHSFNSQPALILRRPFAISQYPVGKIQGIHRSLTTPALLPGDMTLMPTFRSR
ncbi:hypothetical protein M431DRAFT_224192 [Trichoderma harzianum CBS 226.95]|jgi:hypothetical protein|uniref:Uncharacterized protein n=1 Tax=Trichoderma harzianum CBS 226.95 TaxID=983964 RepID=A0A2T4A3K7_TRIHA|nr:hypothetical protein M431DRAFT_224192 [Trichoderma harzianum CBS 226.95]PTB51634.1 hypothetical protein M431DRAFT_224192 [Trichoderma harzianum CBS 226.95]